MLKQWKYNYNKKYLRISQYKGSIFSFQLTKFLLTEQPNIFLRVRFKLMRHYDKENTLSFQNITQTMKIKKAKKDTCCHHPDKQGKYRDRQSNLFYCKSCAVQQASRGCPIEDVFTQQPSSSYGTLQQIYERCQSQIHEQIRSYNCNFQQLMQLLTDMQISDLLIFNKKIEENRNIFQQMKQKITYQWDRQQLRQLFASEDSRLVLDKIRGLVEQIEGLKANGRKSCTLQVNYSSKNNVKSQKLQLKQTKMNISNVSSQQPIVTSHESSNQSFVKSHNTNSYKSKNSTVEQAKQSTYQDTPESVKLKTSNNGLKVTSDMAVTMFEKIDVCESISLSHQSLASGVERQSQESGQGRSSFNSLKSRYRYSKNQRQNQN